MSAINNIATQHEREVTAGRRFSFGRNWASFLKRLNRGPDRRGRRQFDGIPRRKDARRQTFLDIGSGSGLSSLAARRLGAMVTSFDFDSHSVACTEELRRRYLADDPSWTIEQGSVLDRQYLAVLGQFDVVYSWGVLHHTGCDVAGDGEFKTDGKAGRAVVHCDLQRLWRSQPVVARAEAPLQCAAAFASPILRDLRLDATGTQIAF